MLDVIARGVLKVGDDKPLVQVQDCFGRGIGHVEAKSLERSLYPEHIEIHWLM